MLTHVDLFSGIGGFALGFQRTGGIKTVAGCDSDEFCKRLWKKNFATPFFDDIHELTKEQLEANGVTRVDIVSGGFPCQPFSTASAGKRYGEAHDSYLWPEMLRVVEETRPAWVVGENVIGIGSMALEQVVSDLEAIGFRVAPPLVIPACAVGHDHRRDRYWILAHANRRSESSSAVYGEAPKLSGRSSNPERMGAKDGLPGGLDRLRLRALGNAIVPQIATIIGNAILEAEA